MNLIIAIYFLTHDAEILPYVFIHSLSMVHLIILLLASHVDACVFMGLLTCPSPMHHLSSIDKHDCISIYIYVPWSRHWLGQLDSVLRQLGLS